MVIQKYNRGNGKYTIGSQASINASSGGSSSTTTAGGGGDTDNYLWGNHNDGTADIEETMFVNGSVYAMPSLYDGLNPDEDDETEDGDVAIFEKQLCKPFEDDNGGNVYAENLLKSFGDAQVDKNLQVDGKGSFNAVEYKTGYNLPDTDDSSKLASTEWVNKKLNAHKTLTVNDSAGNELGKFDNTQDKTITVKNYDSEISGLSGRLTTAETNITNNATNISNNAEEIENIWDAIGDVRASYDKNAPVILFSGILHSNNDDGGAFGNYQPWVVRPLMYAQHTGIEKLELDYLVVGGEKKCTLVVKVIAKDGWTAKPLSVNAINSLNVHCNPLGDFGGNRRSQGFWMTGGVMPADGNIYLQVWRTGDSNNDTTVNDQIAYSAQEINLTIFGTCYKN